MFLEPLDPRRMMAAHASAVIPPSGLDPTFGDAGLFTFRGRFVASGPVARGDGAIFVGGVLRRRTDPYGLPYVVKVRDDGTADPTFGAGGYARLPFQVLTLEDVPNEASDTQPTFAFTSLAYDAANDRVYVGAVRRTHYGDGTTLAITRLTGSGAVDTTYGSRRGTFSYAPPLPSATYATASARATAINPLADGSAVLAVDRQTHASDDYNPVDNVAGQQSLALLKLRPDGTPDPAYGTGGVAQLLGGTVGPVVPDTSSYHYSRSIRRGFFNDVRTDANGVTHVLLRYETGQTYSRYDQGDENTEAASGRFDVKARTVSATGAVDETKSYAWVLFNVKHNGGNGSGVEAVLPDGNNVRAVVKGEPGYGGTAVLHTLRPNQAPVVQRLAPPGVPRVFSIAHSSVGHWFAFNDGLVAGLNSDFTPDPAFGVNGVARAGQLSHFPYVGIVDDADDTNIAVLADEHGRFVALDTAGLVRFA